ncbi:exported hypothetical protein [uncultured Stenotrophomonas sp.]|uniref:Secreted protein n=1 Tax=uncultured Stenotrophomonas sp. TaxID=165438 RepID=A0A1Y5Q751_9GAMM|nr:exported hypothetical protein [uncultured Stenotrophomonas sp.]
MSSNRVTALGTWSSACASSLAVHGAMCASTFKPTKWVKPMPRFSSASDTSSWRARLSRTCRSSRPKLGGLTEAQIMGAHYHSESNISQWKYFTGHQMLHCTSRSIPDPPTPATCLRLGIPGRMRIINRLRGRRPSPPPATGNSSA